MASPPPKKEKEVSLLQSATTGGRIVRQPALTQFIVDGGGAMVVNTMEFYQVEKWAKSRSASGNRMADRNRFLDQFQTLVARPGSFVGTRGSSKTLEDLCKTMKTAGLDLAEWQLPPDLKELGKPKSGQPAPKKAKPEEGDLGQEPETGVSAADDNFPDL